MLWIHTLGKSESPSINPSAACTGHTLLSCTRISLGGWQQLEGHSKCSKCVVRRPHLNGVDLGVLTVKEHVFSRQDGPWTCCSYECWWEASGAVPMLVPMWITPGCVLVLFTCIPELFPHIPALFSWRWRGGFPAGHCPALCSPPGWRHGYRKLHPSWMLLKLLRLEQAPWASGETDSVTWFVDGIVQRQSGRAWKM